ncbi:hypothetical protein FBU59_001665, partial [Linderina macrospora]
DEQYIFENIGLDSVMFLRFFKLGIILMCIFMIIGTCVILPLNFVNGNNMYVTSDLKKFMLTWLTFYHITDLKIFWLHLSAAYLFTIIVFVFIWRELRAFIALRQRYFTSDSYQRLLQSRTLMVTRVPEDQQSDEALDSFMANRCTSVLPTQASIARKLGQLPTLINEHEQLVRKLEKVLYKYLAGGNLNQAQRPQVKINGAMVDAIEHYTVAIEDIENTVNQVRRENHTFKPTTVGFVSYASPLAAHDAMRGLKNVSPAVVHLAPHPKDVIWTNVQMPKSVRVARVWSARAISVVFCFVAFWPVAALTFIGDAANIQALWPSTADFFTRNDFITTIWQTTFSPLILALYYIAVPHVFRAISRYQGISTKTAVERAVVKKMYVFYILSNLIVLTLVGFVVRVVFSKQSFKDSISTLPSQFISALNNKNQFWTAYVSLKGMNAMLEFAQPISLIMIFIKRYTRDLTPRELRDLTQPPDLDYAPVYSLYLWIYTISMFYSVYAPITFPFAFLDFVLAYWVYKYAVMYVYQTKFETGGDMWRSVINRMVVSLVIFQVYLIGCIKCRISEFTDRQEEMKRAQVIVYSLIPLPVLTTIAGYMMFRRTNPQLQYMQHTVETESFNTQRSMAEDAKESLGDRFLHPMFSQQLTTPVVDRRVRHLLPKVYRGRTSLFVDPNAPPPTQDSIETKFSGGTLTNNPSFISGGDALEAQSMMDARDRRDFDGTSTAMGMYSNGPGSRRYSIDSTTTNGEMVELLSMSNRGHNASLSPSNSRANLLGNAQPISLSRSPSPSPHNGSTLSFGNLDGLDNPHNMNRDTFDPIDLYGGDESSGNEKGHMGMLQQQPGAMARNEMLPPRYGQQPGPGMRPPMMRPGPPGPRPNMMRPGPPGPQG